MKRRRSESEDPERCRPKRQRKGCRLDLLDFSDEILIKILGNFSVQQLTTADRICRRIHRLASDSELWKAKFYDKWVSPRARRIPRTGRTPTTDSSSLSSTKLVRWLENGPILRAGSKVDWKRQYKIRNNWNRGTAQFHEVEVANPPVPPVLARVHRGMVLTADTKSGLRVWSQTPSSKELRAQVDLGVSAEPTSLAVDSDEGDVSIVVGFNDGDFKLFRYSNTTHLIVVLDYQTPTGAAITSIALAMPYVVTMSSDRHINLYHLIQRQCPDADVWSVFVLTSLHADSPLQPASLAVRCASDLVIATISYAFNRLNAGWCLGLQEIRVGLSNGEIETRLTSNIDTHLDAHYTGRSKWEVTSRAAFSSPVTSPFALHPQLRGAPTSLSYSHPYLLASLPDNTIMSYIVISDKQKLEIGSGKRLWGHTSAVSGAEVSNRGKAVSVSAKGDEIRVWELEDALTTVGRQKFSTQIQPQHAAIDVITALAKRGNGLGLALQEMKRELAFTRRWVGFDDQQVVVMGVRNDTQIMACYDFT